MLDGKRSASVWGLVKNIPVTVYGLYVSTTFIVVNGSPSEILIKLLEVEQLLDRLDIERQVDFFTHSGKDVTLNYEYDTRREQRIVSDTDSAEFTSGLVPPE